MPGLDLLPIALPSGPAIAKVLLLCAVFYYLTNVKIAMANSAGVS
jgi:hypothetical protein